MTVKERATEWKFPANFYKQAVRGKLTFSCKEDNYKLKLYDEGEPLSLEKAVKILSLKKATNRELQEPKTAQIECHTANGRVELNVVDCDQKNKTCFVVHFRQSGTSDRTVLSNMETEIADLNRKIKPVRGAKEE